LSPFTGDRIAESFAGLVEELDRKIFAAGGQETNQKHE
jgi:hypothetical protein